MCRHKSDSDFPRWQLAGNGVKQLDQPETGGCFFRREDSRESGERSFASPPLVGDFCRTIDFNYANGAIVKCLFYKLGMYPCTIGKILPRLFFDSSNSISLVLARGFRCSSSFFFSFLFFFPTSHFFLVRYEITRRS